MLEILKPPPGAKKKRKRVGRGAGSGHGKTSARGQKGQGSRAGKGVKPWFEGGQTPLFRRIPKRGFNNRFRVEYQEVNIRRLNVFRDGDVVDKKALLDKGLISSLKQPVKILGLGHLKRKITIKVEACSSSALEKIKEAGAAFEPIT